MTAEQNKAIFLRFVDELRKGNFDIIDEVCSRISPFTRPIGRIGRADLRVREGSLPMEECSIEMLTERWTILSPKAIRSRTAIAERSTGRSSLLIRSNLQF